MMDSEERERLRREAVSAACRVLGIPQEQEWEWDIDIRNLWRQRDDGLWEWYGTSCPPAPARGHIEYIYDTETNAWVGHPREKTP